MKPAFFVTHSTALSLLTLALGLVAAFVMSFMLPDDALGALACGPDTDPCQDATRLAWLSLGDAGE